MAGIYVHIPFCASRCAYCAFYSTTLSELRSAYVSALIRELDLRTHYLNNKAVETIYIGGGTPSQLSADDLRRLLTTLLTHVDVADYEFTMECNPDDVDMDLAQLLASLRVNRVSMGVQSFHDVRLRQIGRRHTARQAVEAVENLRRSGISNVSIDLMYGLPGQTFDEWQQDVAQALSLRPSHVSAYALSIEEDTPLWHQLQRGLITETDEETMRAMYFYIVDGLKSAGYEHYEISNFALPGYRSRHNSSYWDSTPYLGIGAAAHSYDGESRQWNIADVEAYIAAINEQRLPFECEILNPDTKYNELVMTSLRTSRGLNLDAVDAARRSYCLRQAQRYIRSGWLLHEGHFLRITREGIFASDAVISDLLIVR